MIYVPGYGLESSPDISNSCYGHTVLVVPGDLVLPGLLAETGMGCPISTQHQLSVVSNLCMGDLISFCCSIADAQSRLFLVNAVVVQLA
jgi:hypothetical protein